MNLLSLSSGRLLIAGIGCLSAGFGIAACGSSSASGSGNGSDAGSNGSCTGAPLTIEYDPMFSAYIPGAASSVSFQVPARVVGVSLALVTWTYDRSVVMGSIDTTLGVEMFTVVGIPDGGTTTISATYGTSCGSAPLAITSATMDQWMAGEQRYNNGVPLGTLPMFTAGQNPNFNISLSSASIFEPTDGGPGPACTNCHGPTATGGMFVGVEHTPEQTAGFDDQQLTDIIVNGVIPDGGTYDTSIIPYQFWQFFHRWSDLTQAQRIGMVIYLRSLTPASQGGKFDFMGPPGFMGGGGEAGTIPPEDAGTTESDSMTGDATAVDGAASITPSDAAPAGDATPE